jgi:hypothetical protein
MTSHRGFPPVKVPKPSKYNSRKNAMVEFTTPEQEPPKSLRKNADIPKGLARQTIRHLIDTRYLAVYKNPALITDKKHRMDQSDIFYPMRTMLSRKGYDVKSLSGRKGEVREKLYTYIKEYCEDVLKIKRHQIGIFAADRAVMAYQGKTYSVSFENVKELAKKGVDIICIEKEGIVEKLSAFTEDLGIALVQSQGFVSEYGIMLATEAKKTGANVMILTDFDVDGIKIAFQLEGVTRIGIDFDSIDEINKQIKAELEGKNPFEPESPGVPPVSPMDDEDDDSIYKPDMDDLDPELDHVLDLDELKEGRSKTDTHTSLEYLTQGLERKSRNNHKLVPIKGTKHERQYINYLLMNKAPDGETYLKFLETNRIELNTIMVQIGPKRFFNFLYSQIIKNFPTRRYYGRVMQVPPYVITLDIIDELKDVVDGHIDDCIEDEVNVITGQLIQVKGFLNVKAKMLQIHKRLTDIIDEDEKLTEFRDKLEDLIESSF